MTERDRVLTEQEWLDAYLEWAWQLVLWERERRGGWWVKSRKR